MLGIYLELRSWIVALPRKFCIDLYQVSCHFSHSEPQIGLLHVTSSGIDDKQPRPILISGDSGLMIPDSKHMPA